MVIRSCIDWASISELAAAFRQLRILTLGTKRLGKQRRATVKKNQVLN